ncbi:hypothetical protein AAG906_021710 [Vitis piasezkii]
MEHLQILYDIAWPWLYHDLYSPRHLLLLFHSLLVMLLWNYFSIVSTDSGGVPLNWKPMADEEKGDVNPLLGLEHIASEAIRFCRKCNLFKPPDAIIALFVGDAY